MNCEEAKQKIGIRTVMESFNLLPSKENRRTAFYYAIDREERTPSFSVDFVKNKAFDFGTGKSYDVISIVQQMKKCSVADALNYLERFKLSIQNKNQNAVVEREKDYEILKVIEVTHPALIQYLKSRGVDQQKEWVKEIHYEINGKRYFGIGFLNDSEGWEIRNMFSKICLGCKDVTWVKMPQNNAREIIIFEGFFDYLTYRSMIEEEDSDFLILNSNAMLFKIEDKLSNYEKISLFLDCDDNGKSATLKIQKQYSNVEDCSSIYAGFDDLNHWYCKRK